MITFTDTATDRILTSLGHLGFTRYKRPWIEFLENEMVNNGQLTNARQSLERFWKKTLDVDSAEYVLFSGGILLTCSRFIRKTKETKEDRVDSVFFQHL
jgi:hypothetical protein